nr:transposase, Ptta/En/Spm, transposase, Tnp1/En/Spm-like protein [Tanacetum cinerariifolium]
AFVGGSWSDSDEDEDEKTNDEKCLIAKASNKAKKESSDEDSSTFDSEDEEYAMAVRDFKKFF